MEEEKTEGCGRSFLPRLCSAGLMHANRDLSSTVDHEALWIGADAAAFEVNRSFMDHFSLSPRSKCQG